MNDVYDHAPECDVSIWLERAIETDAPRWLGVPDDVACQCQKLQACEARVRDGEVISLKAAYRAGRKRGHAEGVQAARDAVAAAYDDPAPMKDGMTLREEIAEMYGRKVMFEDAIDAIDALKEDAK